MSFLTKRYRGDPQPLPAEPVAGGHDPSMRAEPLEQPAGTSTSGSGFPLPNFQPTLNLPIVGQPGPARSFLALLPVSWGWVMQPQAGGARRLFPNNRIGAHNQSGTPQARESQRIVRPAAGPWDRGGAVGGD